MNPEPETAELAYGAAVRVRRPIRNDGTFPGEPTGALLVRRGSVGYVVDRGMFLQDQVIYAVHFPEDDRRVGCRAEELQPADAPWVPSRFDRRDRVRCNRHLAVGGEVVAPLGSEGKVMEVRAEAPDRIHYTVDFNARLLELPEALLEPVEDSVQGAPALPQENAD